MRNRFDELAKKEKPLFIPFIVAGDPTPDATIHLALTLEEEGADILELGIPYSDPLADGPVIQKASKRALSQGMNLSRAIKLVSAMREKGLTIPVVIFTYFNPLLQLGFEKFFEMAKTAGVDGMLVPDLPHEESVELRGMCVNHEIHLIPLLAPTTRPERMEEIIKEARGFVYCVSSLGVTGARSTFHTSIFEFLKRASDHAKVPVAIGFGISSREQFVTFEKHCDAVVIGSAIVNKVEELEAGLKRNDSDSLRAFASHIRSLVPSKLNTK